MSEVSYPILVARLTKAQAVAVVCRECGAVGEGDAAENAGIDGLPCPADCGHGWSAEWMYAEADHKCPNCGSLGFFAEPHAPCCSRLCALQHEHAVALRSVGGRLG